MIVNVKNMEMHRVIITNRKTLKCTMVNLLRIYNFCKVIKLIIVGKSAPQARKIDSVPVNKTQICCVNVLWQKRRRPGILKIFSALPGRGGSVGFQNLRIDFSGTPPLPPPYRGPPDLTITGYLTYECAMPPPRAQFWSGTL